ncbi:hypothetical protein ACCAA_400063 [Candidatus Accumulibacter aalborgensis]|uniref:Uncharacterized protein n=1 Tax=Candidatus Accumulibacter aalborgensis TaxID=1860102 RepID=A0A1A8XTE3_9PROT|nr:hypothetical protein ACCAA_400063 [Candidatus Accumulibacter aalborgensis]
MASSGNATPLCAFCHQMTPETETPNVRVQGPDAALCGRSPAAQGWHGCMIARLELALSLRYGRAAERCR